MHVQQIIQKCLLLLLNFQNVQSFRLYQLNDLSEGDFVNRLKDIVKNHGNRPQRNILDIINSDLDNESRKSKNLARTRMSSAERERLELGTINPIFVKRIIPHGYKMGGFEYDNKLKTIYRPLIRVHVKKPMSEVENEIMNGKKPANGNGFIVSIQNRNSPKNDLVRHIKQLINKNVNYEKPGESDLRSIFDKSGEERDPYAPANYILFAEKPAPTKSPVRLPDYPYWNYWTYDKTIHVDECPGKLVKVGNTCMGLIN